MSNDERLAGRLREAFAGRTDIVEKKVPGGFVFLHAGHFCCGTHDDSLMVRVGPDACEDALRRPDVRKLDAIGQKMSGCVIVDAAGIAEDRDLRAWLSRSLTFTGSLPPQATSSFLSWPVRQGLFLFMAAFVIYVQGIDSPAWPWNIAPIGASYFLLDRARRVGGNPGPAIAFFLGASGTVLLGHGLELDGTAFAALDYRILPIYAFALGGAGWLVMQFLVQREGANSDD